MAIGFVAFVALVLAGPQDVHEDGSVFGGVDDDLVVEEGVRRRRAGIVEEIIRGVASAADGARGPRANGHFDGVARVELRPANAGPRAFVVLFGGERHGAVFAVNARAQDFDEVPFLRNVLEELVLRARGDHDFARIVNELRHATIGMHDDGAEPVELAVGHVRGHALSTCQDDVFFDEVFLVLAAFLRFGLRAHLELGAKARFARGQRPRACQKRRNFGVFAFAGEREGLRQTEIDVRAVRREGERLLVGFEGFFAEARAEKLAGDGDDLIVVRRAAFECSMGRANELGFAL